MNILSKVSIKLHQLNFFSDRIVNSVKTTLACLIGLLLLSIVRLDAGQWVIITIVVVMSGQLNFGGAVLKSLMRFIGTVAGTLIAIFTLLFFPHNEIALWIILISSWFGFSYVASGSDTLNNAGTLGGVTVSLILLSNNPTLETAYTRFAEIIIGIIIALLISKFVLPIQANIRLRSNFSNNIKQLKDFYEKCIISTTAVTRKTMEDMDDEIIRSFSTQRKLLTEAMAERRKSRLHKEILDNVMLCERKIYRSMCMLHYGLSASTIVKEVLSNNEQFKSFNQQMIEKLNLISASIYTMQNYPDLSDLTSALIDLENDIFTLSLQYPFEVQINLLSSLFCCRYLVRQLHQFVDKNNIV